jgi:16S rRNA processing protein RimM
MKVFPTTDDPSRFGKLERVLIFQDGELKEYKLENVRFHKQFVLIKLDGVNDRTIAQSFKKAEIKIPDSLALPLRENEYYIRDLYGLEVFDENGQQLGVLDNVIQTGANDVYCVKNAEGTLLIPAIKDCILDVNIKERIMTVHLLEGLR